ncbi:uncharacterized protein K460DRAFT_37709 [Cucurbitaria berberidis CBS 394.84]|uniref:Uncharacterized protein n=1 Tax=Cucurbitaria berberidis CBS 394.84 TaxID=1168544 RepID=A0A9P4LE82_9PLEO|nr:uncharacterized protein K460DRAFT_37709 [Cucurbitaria berberidis CBS 394.84]KAF1851588.1 hypothetical protein K460DRAFT_37709 [Cucurbitaria berberidis CBS 394.84]
MAPSTSQWECWAYDRWQLKEPPRSELPTPVTVKDHTTFFTVNYCHDGYANSLRLPHLSSTRLTVHPSRRMGLRCLTDLQILDNMPTVCDPHYFVLPASSSLLPLYMPAPRSSCHSTLPSISSTSLCNLFTALHYRRSSFINTFPLQSAILLPQICHYPVNIRQNVLSGCRTLLGLPLLIP